MDHDFMSLYVPSVVSQLYNNTSFISLITYHFFNYAPPFEPMEICIAIKINVQQKCSAASDVVTQKLTGCDNIVHDIIAK
ncbi:MAG: hypothetical protein MJE68_07120 [Proteobacteria bacterium]|nr:hypothetical protein [Pseudomonadota bacterium]